MPAGAAFRRLIRRTGDPLRDELAISWRAMLVVAAPAVLGLAAAVPVLSLRRNDLATGTALSLPPIAPVGPVLPWTSEVMNPAATRAVALGDLFAVLVAVAWAVLAIAVVSMLGRLVAQAYERAPEIGIRRSVGARRSDILLTQLAEAFVVAMGVLAIALPAGYGALALAAATWPGSATGLQWAPLAGTAIVTGVLALGALLPLAHRSARRLAGGDPMPVTLGVPAVQMAAALALLTAAGVMLRHADGAGTDGSPVAAPAGVVWELAGAGADTAARAAAYESLLVRLAADSRYEVASLASRGTHSGLGTVDFDVTDCGYCVRGMIVMRWLNLYATHHAISPDTFTAAGISLVSGRNLALTDDWDAPRVAVVNRHLAARYFETGGAIGRDIYLGSAWPNLPHRVVGIVDDERPAVLGGAVQPRETVYVSALQHPPVAAELVVRGADADPLLRAELGASARFQETGTERDRAAADAAPLVWFGRWFGFAGAAAFIVAIIATFDTIGLWVRSVAGELAMRRATGATRRRIAMFVLVRAATAVLAGTAIGMLLFVTLIREYLVRSVPALSAGHAPVAAVCAVILLAAALVSAAVAARRFLATEPARWLR